MLVALQLFTVFYKVFVQPSLIMFLKIIFIDEIEENLIENSAKLKGKVHLNIISGNVTVGLLLYYF